MKRVNPNPRTPGSGSDDASSFDLTPVSAALPKPAPRFRTTPPDSESPGEDSDEDYFELGRQEEEDERKEAEDNAELSCRLESDDLLTLNDNTTGRKKGGRKKVKSGEGGMVRSGPRVNQPRRTHNMPIPASAGGGRECNTHTSITTVGGGGVSNQSRHTRGAAVAANAKIAADATTSGSEEDSAFGSDDDDSFGAAAAGGGRASSTTDGRKSASNRERVSDWANNLIATDRASSTTNAMNRFHVNTMNALCGTSVNRPDLLTILATSEARHLITTTLRANDDDSDVDSDTEYVIDPQLLAFCFDTTASKFDTVCERFNDLPDQPCGKWEAKRNDEGKLVKGRLTYCLEKLHDYQHFEVIWPGGRPRLASNDSWKNNPEIANAPIKLIYKGNEGKNMSYMCNVPWYMELP